MSPLYQDSEIAPLEAVIVHEPGPEVEQMTPATAQELLYNDIVPGEVVRKEHRLFRSILEKYTKVLELSELLEKALETDGARASVRARLAKMTPWLDLGEAVDGAGPARLARLLVEGLPKRPRGFAEYFAPRHYDLHPLPNLYFMRDSAFVFRDTLFLSSMAHEVRAGETLLTEIALRYGGESAGYTPSRIVQMEDRLEGGDIHVLSSNLLLAGISQRTSAAALDALASEAARATGEMVTVIGVVLPDKRSTIHLDMVFTQIDRDLALVHDRTLRRAEVLTLEASPGGKTVLQEEATLADALDRAGAPMRFIRCGGDDAVSEAREQWLAAANTVALGPGVILTFQANSATNRRLEEEGFTLVVPGDEELPPPPLQGRYAFAVPGVELARGGGGPRCMTLPIRRKPRSD